MSGEAVGPETGGAFLMALVVIIIAGYPYYIILSMLFNNTASGSEAAIYFVVYTGFVGGVLATWGTGIGWLMLALVLMLSVSYPWLLGVSERRAMWKMDLEDLAKCDAFIRRAPTVVENYDRAITICRRRGEYPRAIEYAEAYLAVVSEDHKMQRRIEQLRRQVRRQTMRSKICPICDTENPAGVAQCIRCGRVLALPTDVVAGCATETGLRAMAATTITLLAIGIALALLNASPLVIGIIFVSAFVTAVTYTYLRR